MPAEPLLRVLDSGTRGAGRPHAYALKQITHLAPAAAARDFAHPLVRRRSKVKVTPGSFNVKAGARAVPLRVVLRRQASAPLRAAAALFAPVPLGKQSLDHQQASRIPLNVLNWLLQDRAVYTKHAAGTIDRAVSFTSGANTSLSCTAGTVSIVGPVNHITVVSDGQSLCGIKDISDSGTVNFASASSVLVMKRRQSNM